MSDVDQLQALGQQLTTALVSAYSATAAGGNVVFLPMGAAVPDDIVQSGIVNPTALQQWLSINFDFPFIVSSAEAAVLSQESTHGTASFIYTLAVNNAQPVGAPADAAWQRLAAELGAARQALGSASQMNLVCEPDDWLLPTATSYWTTFDSSQTASTSTSATTVTATAPQPVPVPDPRYWRVRSFETVHPQPTLVYDSAMFETRLPLQAMSMEAMSTEATISPEVMVSERVLDRTVNPAIAELSQRPTFATSMAPVMNVDTITNGSTTVSNVTSSNSSITIQLQHQCVAIGRYSAGQPCWNGGILSDPEWYVPGFAAGGILPAPQSAQPNTAYALPVAIIIVQQLQVSGQWSQDALSALSASSGSVGPLGLFGAAAVTQSDGLTVSFSHPGMQVIALLCSPLPVIPPVGAPMPIDTSSSTPPTAPATTASVTPVNPAAASATSVTVTAVT